MSTIREIIDWADRKYPNSESDANKVIDLNDIHKEVYIRISKAKNEREIWSFTTEVITNEDGSIVGIPAYDLPADCKIELIDSVKISQTVSPSSPESYVDCDYAGIDDDIASGYFYFDSGVNPDTGYNMIGLANDGDVINTADLEVRVYYTKRPEVIDAVTDTPSLDPDYHALLKYALVNSLASQGNNPDTEIADFYQKKYDDFLKIIEDDIEQKYNKTPNRISQNVEQW